jgi:hypothetical protein
MIDRSYVCIAKLDRSRLSRVVDSLYVIAYLDLMMLGIVRQMQVLLGLGRVSLSCSFFTDPNSTILPNMVVPT